VNESFTLSLLGKHRIEGAVIDTNLLVLLFVGSYDANRIESFKRTMQYTKNDFSLLINILKKLDRRIVTPNILTEADNLCRQLPEREHAGISATITKLCDSFLELYVPARDVTADLLYTRLGITDCIIAGLAKQKRLVITDDFALEQRISSAKGDVININHLRRFV
jgi:hypothetical protein